MRHIALCAVLFFAHSLRVYGWWDTGHMLVSEIAWKHLNQAAAPEVVSALENAVNSLVAYSGTSNTFVTAACWMDDIKNRGIVQFSNWHFINLPFCDFPNSNDTDSCNGISVGSMLSSQDDVLWAITTAANTIKNRQAAGFERGFALRNLLHLVGDLHQPLHAVARFSNETPNGDQGGNLFRITNVPFTNNLHGFWDSGVGMLNNSLTRPLNSSAASYLSNLADEIIARTANLTNNVTTYNVTEWALESRDLSMLYVYNLSYNSTPSDYYISQGWEVVQNQIGLAGYRLHLLLKQITPCASDLGNCPDEPNEKKRQRRDDVDRCGRFPCCCPWYIGDTQSLVI